MLAVVGAGIKTPWLYSESRPHATRPPPRWSSATGDGPGKILSNVVLSQINEHAAFGGVVPEIAARAHVEALDRIIAKAMAEAGKTFGDIDGVAAAAGPGLIGGVIVGLTTAKAIALVNDKPLMAINHLEAHALTARLTDGDAVSLLPVPRLRRPHPDRRGARRRRLHACSAPRSTTPSAKPSTRPRSCWGSAIPAARRSRRKRRAATPRASRCRGRCRAGPSRISRCRD